MVSRSRAYKVTTTELAAKIQKKEDMEQLREQGGSGAKVKQWMGSIAGHHRLPFNSDSQLEDQPEDL